MKQGFVKVAAVTPNMRVADVEYNVNEICRMIDETTEQGAKVIAFPELCITGYTCGDLFSQEILLREAKQGLYRIAEYTKEKDALIFVGVPYEVAGKLYNTAAALNHGKVLGLVTKTFLPNYGEFYEKEDTRAAGAGGGHGTAEDGCSLWRGCGVPGWDGLWHAGFCRELPGRATAASGGLCPQPWCPSALYHQYDATER